MLNLIIAIAETAGCVCFVFSYQERIWQPKEGNLGENLYFWKICWQSKA